jgi:hypothetical protein
MTFVKYDSCSTVMGKKGLSYDAVYNIFNVIQGIYRICSNKSAKLFATYGPFSRQLLGVSF